MHQSNMASSAALGTGAARGGAAAALRCEALARRAALEMVNGGNLQGPRVCSGINEVHRRSFRSSNWETEAV